MVNLLTIREVAERLNLTSEAVRLKIHKTLCPFERIGNLIVIKKKDAVKFLGYPVETAPPSADEV